MLKEEYEEWMSVDEDIPVAATQTGLEFCQAVCEHNQAINVGDSDGNECVEENPPTNTKMSILKLITDIRGEAEKKTK
ncbi:hypothetical protein AVEN_248856-1 [Araneus ventricosus]|uniref:Uncharacterized protein n=1 Tax=Araneus ventricosus TaxID=182803 RepID=A0A4Y2RXI6_ARAVE|nr:hypothetical protein AVEN_232870-1 [Araneus ventricosus]GBN80103.1 hypothetical protein AVEN_248856-1 [Araneus ventricosus]